MRRGRCGGGGGGSGGGEGGEMRWYNTSSPKTDQSICKYYRKGECRHGFTGPEEQMCTKFRKWGHLGTFGCKGGKNCDRGLHPQMCRDKPGNCGVHLYCLAWTASVNWDVSILTAQQSYMIQKQSTHLTTCYRWAKPSCYAAFYHSPSVQHQGTQIQGRRGWGRDRGRGSGRDRGRSSQRQKRTVIKGRLKTIVEPN